jgi:hypothetical protein
MFDGEPYGGKIMRVSTKVAFVHFDDGEDHEIELSKLVRQRADPVESGDSDDEDDTTPDPVDYTVKPGEKILKRDVKGAPIVIQRGTELKYNPPSRGSGRAAHHYPVVWDEKGLFFNVWAAPDAEDVTYGENAADLMTLLESSKTGMVHFSISASTFSSDRPYHRMSPIVNSFFPRTWSKSMHTAGNLPPQSMQGRFL